MAWNKPSVASAPSPTPKRKPTAWRGAVAGGVVALAAIIAAVVIFSGGDAKPKAKEGKKPAAIKEVKPAASPKVPSRSTTKREKTAQATGIDAQAGDSVSNLSDFVGIGTLTNKKHTTVFGKSVFGHPTDQVIAMTLSGTGDTPAPPVPLPKTSDREFRKSLDTPIEILDTDSDRIREIKEKVIAAREEIKERMDRGESFASILAEHQKDELENYTTRRNAMIELKEIIGSGDLEGAQKYVDTVNLCFQQMGIKEIKMPSKTQKGKVRPAANNSHPQREPTLNEQTRHYVFRGALRRCCSRRNSISGNSQKTGSRQGRDGWRLPQCTSQRQDIVSFE